MTNQEILEKSIKKAIDGGWKEPNGNTLSVDKDGHLFSFFKDSSVRAYGYRSNLERLIYSHDFAKALWGEKPYLDQGDGSESLYRWQYHLQNMVIAEDPIKYLGENM